jgi:hypothetical protein
VDQHHVGAGRGVGAAALERFLHAPAGNQRFGAGDDHEVRIALRALGRTDLAGVLLDAGELATHARVEAAALGEDVVFDADGGDAGALVLLDAADDVDGIAVAIVAIGDHGELGGVVDLGGDFEVLRHGKHAGVRHGARRSDLEPARPHPVEAGFFGQPGGQAVVRPHQQHRRRARQQFAELRRLAHRWLSNLGV